MLSYCLRQNISLLRKKIAIVFLRLTRLSALFVLKIVNIALGFGLAIFLARQAGAATFGAYVYCVSIATILAVPAKLSLDAVVTRFGSKYIQKNQNDKARALLKFSLLLVSCFAFAVMAVASLVALFIHDQQRELMTTLCITLTSLLPLSLMAPMAGLEAARHEIFRSQAPTALFQPIIFLMLLAGIGYANTLTSILVASAYSLSFYLTLFIATAQFLLTTRSLKLNVSPRWGRRDRSQWLQCAMPLTVTGILFLVNTNADVIILGASQGPNGSGLYKSAVRGAELIVFFLAIINAPLAPLIAQQASVKARELQTTLTSYSRISATLGVALAIVLILMPEIFLGIFGKDFAAGGAATLRILCVGQLAVLLSGPATVVLAMTGHSRLLAVYTGVSAVLNIFLNLLLVRRYGVEGAAIATSCTAVIWSFFLATGCKKRTGLNPTPF